MEEMITTGVGAFLTQHIGYLTDFEKNIATLKGKVEEMIRKRDDIRASVQSRQANGEMITQQVEGWLRTADTIEEGWNTLYKEVEENDNYVMGYIPKQRWCYKLSKRAKKDINTVDEHLSKGEFDRVTMPTRSPNVEIFPHIPKIEGLASAESSMKKIMHALCDKKIRTIGVHGMAGVGKTTIVKNVNNQLKETSIFDVVIMVTVSKDMDVKSLQNEIANRLDLNLEGESEISRQRKLRLRFMQEEKFLIIVDDLWGWMDPGDIGIPCGGDHMGCKLILTSRNELVCRKMASNVLIKVDVLSEEESWKLFKETVGNVVDDSALQAISREVAKKCAGLPLAIVTVGRELRERENIRVWEHALSELKNSDPTSFVVNMKPVVYQSIRNSYDHLPKELKMCFLFCCLFPEAYDIGKDYLIKYWMAEGFIENVENWEAALNKGHAVIDELKASCLLLDGKRTWCTRMHNIVRDAALNIASNDEHKFLVRVGLQLDNWIKVNRGKECTKLSLMKNRFRKLEGRMEHPQLLTLMIQENLNLYVIKDEVFMGMDALRVLDLSNTVIRWLPVSISRLVNLRKLSLRECRQLETSCLWLLGKLGELEFLNLSRTDITALPSEIEKLTKLRCLDLSLTQSLENIPANAISKLVNLEELKMLGSSYKWEVEGHGDRSNATLAEVASLTQLSCLFICMEDIHRFSQDVLFESWVLLKRFCFFFNYKIGDSIDVEMLEEKTVYRRTMSISDSNIIPEWVKKLFLEITCLKLRKHDDVNTILELGTVNNDIFRCLEHLELRECDDIEYLVHGDGLQQLEHLELHNLSKLEKIILGDCPNLLGKRLQNLKSLKISGCHSLKSILSLSVLAKGWLPHLIELDVRDCKEVEEIISEDEEMLDKQGVLLELKTMSLVNLPKLEQFFGRREVLNFHLLQEIHVWCCPNMKKLPLEAHNAPFLESIYGLQEWWDGLNWHEDNAKAHFESIFFTRSHTTINSGCLSSIFAWGFRIPPIHLVVIKRAATTPPSISLLSNSTRDAFF